MRKIVDEACEHPEDRVSHFEYDEDGYTLQTEECCDCGSILNFYGEVLQGPNGLHFTSRGTIAARRFAKEHGIEKCPKQN